MYNSLHVKFSSKNGLRIIIIITRLFKPFRAQMRRRCALLGTLPVKQPQKAIMLKSEYLGNAAKSMQDQYLVCPMVHKEELYRMHP